MKRIGWVALAAAGATVMTIALAGASSASDTERTLSFVNRPVKMTDVDVDGDHDLTPGDLSIGTSVLVKDGKVVGRMVSSCQFIAVRADGMGGDLQCTASATLPRGQVTAQGRVVLLEGSTRSAEVAVTGGTGAYATVGGYATTEAIPGTMNTRVTFHLMW